MTFRSRILSIAILLAFSILYTSHLHAAATSAAGESAAQATPEPDIKRSFQIRYASVGDVMTIVRSIYGLHHLAADETRNLLTVRDTAENVEATRRLIARYDTRPPTTLVSFELVTLDPLTGAPESGTALLHADTAIVGNGSGRMRVDRAPLAPTQWLDLAVDLQARLQGDEILLQLDIESAVLRTDSENTRAKTQGTWRSGSGAPLLVQLPLHVEVDGQRKILGVRVTPRITRDPGQSG